MKNEYIAIKFIVIISSATIVPLAHGSTCSDAFDQARVLEPSEYYTLPNPESVYLIKDPYEKKSEFTKRVEEANKKGLEKLSTEAQKKSAQIQGLVKITAELTDYNKKYNPEKELMTIKDLIYSRELSYLGIKKKFLEVTIKNTSSSSKPYLLGTTQSSSKYFGIGYTTLSKNKFLNGKSESLVFKLNQTDARNSAISLAVEFVGKYSSPYTFSSSFGYDDWSRKTMNTVNTNYVILDVLCARVIHRINKQVYFEIN